MSRGGTGRGGARKKEGRSADRGTRKRSSRKAPRRRPWRLRAAVAALVLLLGLGGWLVVRQIDFDRAIREVTLPLRYEDIIRQQADDKEVDASLIAAVIYAESRFRDRTSPAGARGLMQITPDTADVVARLSGAETFVHEDLADPDINIRYGTFYLRYLLDRYEGNEEAALAGYNAGHVNADRWGGADLDPDDITFPETSAYVEQVLRKRHEYRDTYADELGLD